MEEVISIRENVREHYKELFNSSLDLIYVIDVNGIFIDANDIALETFGYKREELMDIMLNDLLDQEYTEKFFNGVKEIIKNGRNRDYIELKLKTKNSDAVYIETYGIPIKGNGKICAIIGIANDVTARKQTELKLRESEEKYRLIAENAIDMIGIINQNFEIEYLNEKAAITIKGRTKGDLIGKNISEVLHPDDIKKAYDALKNGFKEGEGKEEVRVRHKDGNWMWIDVKGKTNTNEEGDMFAIIIARDITERKEAEKKLEEFDNNLRKLVRELNCLYSISTIIDSPDLSINDVIESILELIPHACQFPTLTCARIIYNDKKYETDNLRKTKWKFSTQVIINEKPLMISVYFLENVPFLKSEIDLIKEIGNRLKIIIEQKESEQKLKESEAQLTSLLENTPDFIITVDRNNIIQYINHIPQKIIKEPVIGMNLYEYLMPENQDMYKHSFEKVFETGFPLTIDVPGFAEAWYTTRFIPIKRGGDSDLVMLIVTNITDIKEAEKKLRESEEKYRNIIENTKDAIIVYGIDGILKFSSPQLEKILGRKIKPGTKIFKHIHPDDLGRLAELLRRFVREKRNFLKEQVEYRVLHGDGHYVWLSGSADYYNDEDGSSINLISALRDITEKKHTEEKLRESEEKYRLISENANDMIAVINEKFEYEYINEETTSRLMGYNNNDAIGKSVLEFIHPSDKTIVIEALNKGFRTGEAMLQLRFKQKDGNWIWLESRGKLFRDRDDQLKGLIISRDITGRINSEQKIRESEEKYRSLVENSPNSIALLNSKGVIIDCNKETATLIGLSMDKILGNKYIDLFTIPKEKTPWLIETFKKAIKNDLTEPIEFEFNNKEDVKKWVESSVSLIVLDNETLIQVVSQDITSRKIAEQMLKDSEKKYRVISENAYDMITVINEKFEYEYVNEKAHQDVLGYSKDELLGKPAVEMLHPDDVRKVMKKWRKGIKKGEETSELRFRKKDDTYLWLEVRGKLFKDRDGFIKGILISRDINKRKLAEEKLRESEEKYRSILENMREGYIETDLKGNFTFVNKRVSEFSGYSKDELYKMKVNQVIADKDIDNILEKSKKLIKGEVDQIVIEYETIPKEGPHKYIEASVNLKYDSQGNKIGFYGVYRDITERKEAKELIKKEREKLKELDVIKRDLTTQLSEKLKYPLSVISDVSEVLIESYQDQLDTNAQRLLELIREGGEKSTNMIERILDISKIESHKFQLKKQIENINEIVNECIHEAYENLKFREVGITLKVREEIFAEVDKIRFKQIFEYFLISSMKNTPKQEKISISLQKKDDYAKIQIKNHEIEAKYDEYPFEMQYSDDIMKLHQGVLLREFDRNKSKRTITIMLPMINWYDKLIHLYIIYHSGILLYDHPFLIEGDSNDSLIISGGIIGMMSMLKEIIKGEKKIRTIDHGDRKIMFKLNSTEDVVFVLIVEEENPVIKKKLNALIEDFEDYYREQMKDIKRVCIMTHKWKGTIFLVKKHFKS